MYGGLGQVLPRTWLSAVRVDASPLARAILVVCSSMADNDKAIKDRLYLRNAGYFDWYDLIDGDDTCRHLPLIGGMGILMPARRVFSNQSMARDVTRSVSDVCGEIPLMRRWWKMRRGVCLGAQAAQVFSPVRQSRANAALSPSSSKLTHHHHHPPSLSYISATLAPIHIHRIHPSRLQLLAVPSIIHPFRPTASLSESHTLLEQ